MKKVLFMPVGFFEYDKIIEDAMRELGYDVTVFSPMQSYGTLYQKILNTISRGWYIKRRANRLQKKFYEMCSEQFDFVLAIVGRDIDAGLFSEFKNKQKHAKYILYLWDDLIITKKYNFDNIHNLFDEIVSFCPQDCEKYGFRYRPTFYTDYYRYDGEDKLYKISMMGSSHSGRVEVWKNIVERYNILEKDTFLYLLAGTVSELFNGKKTLKQNKLSPKNIHIYGVPLEKSAEISRKSRIVLDIQQTGQKGLTMRTYESMVAGCKLITTNEYVKEYEFYNPKNICVVEKGNPIISDEFWNGEFQELSKEFYENYSVKKWVEDMLV